MRVIGNTCAARVREHSRCEFWNNGGDRSVQIEETTLIQNHRRRGRSQDFGDRSQIEYCVCGNCQ